MKQLKNQNDLPLILSCILVCGGGQGVLINTSSVFIKPVCDALGFARGDFSLYASIAMLLMMALLPVFGTLYNKSFFRHMLLPMGVVSTLVPLGYSFCAQLWQFYLLAAVQGLCINAISMQMVACVITRCFSAKRGLILGASFAGSGLLASGALAIGGWLNAAYGWQTGYRAMALISFLILMPTLPVIAKRGFATISVQPKQAAQQTALYGISFRKALRMPPFYLLLVSLFLMGLVLQGTMINAIAYLADHGYSVAVQNMVASMSMFVAALAKLGLGQLMDRFGVKIGVLVSFAGMAISGIFLILVDIPIAPYMIILGTALNNSGAVIQSELTRECFGSMEHPRIYTVLSTGCTLGITVGGSVPGYILALCGSYMPAWYGFVIAAVAGLLLCLTAMRLSQKILQTPNT